MAAIFFTSCESVSGQTQILGPDKALSGVIGEFQDYMLSEYNMSISAFGTGGGFDGPKHINLGFRGLYCIEENEARIMIVTAFRELERLVNGNSDLKSALKLYDQPFTAKNLTMMLMFYRKGNSIATEPCVAVVSISEGLVEYFYEVESQEFGYSRIDEESFNEAVAKLGMSQSGSVKK